MTHRLGEWIPVVDVLAPLPFASMAGCCLATAPNGTGRYIYAVFPTSDTAATFWQFDTQHNAWEQLTSPTLDAGLTDRLLTNVSMIVDGTSGLVYLFNSRLAPGVPPFYHRFQSYNPATDAWTQLVGVATLETAAGLGTRWIGDAALCHPCASAGAPASDDQIILVGNNDDSAYVYSIAGNTWAAHAGANRGAVCGVGVSLNWIPSVPTVLYSMRGGGSGLCDVYTIATGAFAAGVQVLPVATAIVTTGVEVATDNRRNALIGQINGRFYEGSPTAAAVGTISPIGQMYGNNGTPHQGRGVVVSRVGNQEYVYYRKQTGSEFQRIEIVE